MLKHSPQLIRMIRLGHSDSGRTWKSPPKDCKRDSPFCSIQTMNAWPFLKVTDQIRYSFDVFILLFCMSNYGRGAYKSEAAVGFGITASRVLLYVIAADVIVR